MCVCVYEREREKKTVENKLSFRKISHLEGHQTGILSPIQDRFMTVL